MSEAVGHPSQHPWTIITCHLPSRQSIARTRSTIVVLIEKTTGTAIRRSRAINLCNTMDSYQTPLSSRYASKEMSQLFSNAVSHLQPLNAPQCLEANTAPAVDPLRNMAQTLALTRHRRKGTRSQHLGHCHRADEAAPRVGRRADEDCRRGREEEEA